MKPDFAMWGKPKILRKGGGSDVYRISDGLVAKVHRAIPEMSSHEFAVADYLYKNGFSVPRPKGVYDIASVYLENAFVMQFIDGKTLDCFSESPTLRERWREIADIEVEKAQKLGFYTEDVNDSNIIVSRKGIFLIDFTGWTNPKKGLVL